MVIPLFSFSCRHLFFSHYVYLRWLNKKLLNTDFCQCSSQPTKHYQLPIHSDTMLNNSPLTQSAQSAWNTHVLWDQLIQRVMIGKFFFIHLKMILLLQSCVALITGKSWGEKKYAGMRWMYMLQRAVMARPQKTWGFVTFVFTEEHSRWAPGCSCDSSINTYWWGKFNSLTTGDVWRSCFSRSVVGQDLIRWAAIRKMAGVWQLQSA